MIELTSPELASLVIPPTDQDTFEQEYVGAAATLSPHHAVGIELRQAWRVFAGELDLELKELPADPAIVGPPMRRLFVRPAFEPIIASHWTELATLTITEASALGMVSALAQRPIERRTRPAHIQARPGERRIEYTDFQPFAEAMEECRAFMATTSAGAGDAAIAVFAKMSLLHPFSDGNGRLARALLHGALAYRTGVRAPYLPLAPSFYVNATRIGPALTAFGGGEAEPTFTALRRLLRLNVRTIAFCQ